MPVTPRHLAGRPIYPIGLGCMSLSHAYGVPPLATQGMALLHAALDAGVNHFDTAALYGFGANETLVGRTLASERARFLLASKCGMHGVDGRRVIDGRPDTIRWSVEQSLQRLQTERIDLLYLHRLDRNVPIEDSVGAMADLVRAGKVGAIGLSEVSAATLRRAHAVYPLAALQSEYSLWTRNPELGVLQACRELGIALVAFSPLGRGFLAGGVPDAESLEDRDIRRSMPRFHAEHHARNQILLNAVRGVARAVEAKPAQVALAWLLAQGDDIVPIPGTTVLAHLQDNLAATRLQLTAEQLERLNRQINQHTVSGARYSPATQQEIDTEEFAD